jgi:hypothetical protein
MTGQFLSLEVLCRFSKMKENDDLIRNHAGQLGGKWRILDGNGVSGLI